MDALKADFTIACPAFPETGRTICHGYLFVGDQLLSESGMKDHPLTPMTDANLVRVLAPQTRRKVGLIGYATVAKGAAAVREAIASPASRTVSASPSSMRWPMPTCAPSPRACADLPLVTAGSGIGLGMADHYRKAGLLAHAPRPPRCRACKGHAAVLSGSCSTATNGQVARWQADAALLPPRSAQPRARPRARRRSARLGAAARIRSRF